MFTKIQDLAYELDGDTFRLEQRRDQDVVQIELHRIHITHLAKLAEIVQPELPSTKDLVRRLLALQERIDYLADYLANHSDHKHADLFYEMTYATATADIAEQFCADLVAEEA